MSKVNIHDARFSQLLSEWNYWCPNCEGKIYHPQKKCSNCKIDLTWPKEQPNEQS